MSQLSINTTQNVVINFTAASVGERIGAYMLDFLVKAAYFIIVYYVFFSFFQIDRWLNQLDRWSQMAVYMVFFLPIAFYSLVQESLMEGQTLGKKILKIKVVKIDGYQASFGDYLIRWLFRVIDISIGSGIIGLIAMVVNSKTQRLGDMSAGTAVITLKNKVTINSTILEDIGEEYQPKYPLVIKLSDNDARIIKETFHNAMKSNDFVVLNKLTAKIEQVTGIKNELGSTRDFIQTVLKDYNYYTQSM
ncbi:RDD family protein [Flavobacterium sp.]|uniref:RDD family protein n=1 Tax=Flavobacterium sp. TaxID=239 RepID=UPI0025F4E91F|nr:RDD family protein [Flavobacterium sp.]